MDACCLSRERRATALLFLVLAPAAGAWTWPGRAGLAGFDLGGDPYAGGQHRGIDIGGAAGSPVVAPRGGTVTFAGPSRRRPLAIATTDGYSVTLVHLGSIAVRRGGQVAEGAVGRDDRPDRVAAHPALRPPRRSHRADRTATSTRWASFLPRARCCSARAPAGACARPRGRAAACEPARPKAATGPAGRPRARAHGRPTAPPTTASPVQPEPVATEAPIETQAPEPAEAQAGTDPEPVVADPSGVTLTARPQPHERQGGLPLRHLWRRSPSTRARRLHPASG